MQISIVNNLLKVSIILLMTFLYM